MIWDMRYTGFNPTNISYASPGRSGPSGTNVLPGVYQVFMSKSENGKVTQLTKPVSFKVVSLEITSLPAANRAELVAFQKKVAELNNAVSASSSLVRELTTKISHYRIALKSLPVPEEALNKNIKNMETKLEKIQLILNGDPIPRRIDKVAVPGLRGRVRGITGDQRRSTSAPTQTHRDAYRIASEEFAPVYEILKGIIEIDVPKIEKRLEELGAPFTPGRLPKWKKK